MNLFNNVVGKNLTIIDLREHREELLMWNNLCKDLLIQGSSLVKINNKVILSTVVYRTINNNIDEIINSTLAIAFFWDMKVYSNLLDATLTLKEITQQTTIDGKTVYDILMSFPRLSEEQFYDDTTLAE